MFVLFDAVIVECHLHDMGKKWTGPIKNGEMYLGKIWTGTVVNMAFD